MKYTTWMNSKQKLMNLWTNSAICVSWNYNYRRDKDTFDTIGKEDRGITISMLNKKKININWLMSNNYEQVWSIGTPSKSGWSKVM